MQSYRVYRRYAAKVSHLFDDKSVSERGWQAALALMPQARENNRPVVTTATLRRYLKTLPRPAGA